MKVPLATLCGCSAASLIVSTGAKHTSVPSMSAHHSSRVFVRKTCSSRLLRMRPEVACPSGSAELGVRGQAGEPQQLGVELRLDRPDRDVAAVRAPVDVVEVRAGVEQVRSSAVLVEHADLAHRPEHGHQHRGAVDHGGVDHLALPAALRLQERADHAVGQQHAAAAEVAHHVERRRRGFAVAPEVGERAGQGDVVDVVAGGVGVRARPGPSPSCARRPAWGCGRGTRPARLPAAPSRRDGSPRSARRPARPGGAAPRRRRGSSGRERCCAGRGCSTSQPGPSPVLSRTDWHRSTRTTSAPMSDSIIAANGPGPMPASSMMRRPRAVRTRGGLRVRKRRPAPERERPRSR